MGGAGSGLAVAKFMRAGAVAESKKDKMKSKLAVFLFMVVAPAATLTILYKRRPLC